MATAKPLQNDLHADISSDFNERYNPNAFGIQNAGVIRTDRNGQVVTSKNRRNRNNVIRGYVEPPQAVSIANTPAPVVTRPRTRRGFIAETITVNVARVRAFPTALAISAWAIPYYLFITLPLGVLASLSLGLSIAIDYYTGELGEGVVQAMAQQISGMDFSAFMVIFLGLSFVLFIFNWIQILIASAMFKIAFVKPWFGNGTSIKTGSIIIILLASFFPLLQIFPLFFLWLAAVVANPK